MNNYFNGKGTIGFTCDSCGRETSGCSIVNGMYFCAKCYQETFGGYDKAFSQLSVQNKQISELEKENEELKKTLDLMGLVFCTHSRPDLEQEIEKFSLVPAIIDYLRKKAKEELEK